MENGNSSNISTQLALIDGTRNFAKSIMHVATNGLADNSTYRVIPEYEWWDDGYGWQRWIKKTWPDWPQTYTASSFSLGYDSNPHNVQSSEKDGLYTVTVDVPGAKKSDIKIVTKKSRAEFSWKRGSASHTASSWIPDHVDHLSAKAKLEDGVLTVHFQVLPQARERVVEID